MYALMKGKFWKNNCVAAMRMNVCNPSLARHVSLAGLLLVIDCRVLAVDALHDVGRCDDASASLVQLDEGHPVQVKHVVLEGLKLLRRAHVLRFLAEAESFVTVVAKIST